MAQSRRIISLVKIGFELGHKTILLKKNATAKFEVTAKSNIRGELEIIRGAASFKIFTSTAASRAI